MFKGLPHLFHLVSPDIDPSHLSYRAPKARIKELSLYRFTRLLFPRELSSLSIASPPTFPPRKIQFRSTRCRIKGNDDPYNHPLRGVCPSKLLAIYSLSVLYTSISKDSIGQARYREESNDFLRALLVTKLLFEHSPRAIRVIRLFRVPAYCSIYKKFCIFS